MGMMGYNGTHEFNTPPEFHGRKLLRPLFPRPPLSTNINHHLDQSKRDELSNTPTQQVVVSSRWNPTPEQLRTLEDLYKQGTRTPSSDQIQHITSQLRRYGKIEGKNVFYWFQNHKARERQKRRREMESESDQEQQNPDNYDSLVTNRTNHEAEHANNNWSHTTDCTSTHPERIAKASSSWVKFNAHEERKNATWHMMQLSCPHLLNTTITTSCPAITPTTSTSTTTTTKALGSALQQLNSRVYCNGFVDHEEENGGKSHKTTLELFPIETRLININNDKYIKENHEEVEAMNANLTSYQFFQFLPLKD